MTEAELLAEVTKRCDQLGLRYHHCRDSRHCEGDPGFPDLVIFGCRKLLFRELKSEDGRSSRAQLSFLDVLRMNRLNIGIWRPEDWDSGRITRELEEIA